MADADSPPLSLAAFAARFPGSADADAPLPRWIPPSARAPIAVSLPATRARVEEVLDTVVALQRAEWLNDGVFVGPSTLPDVYDVVLGGARRLGVAVPPAMVAGSALSSQGIYGTDGRAFLHLSSHFVVPAPAAERRFMVGRFMGIAAARWVTPFTLYALLADHAGLRKAARDALGPLLEVVLAPLSLSLRLVLSRWHRHAEIGADRAGLLCCDDLGAAQAALLRVALGGDRGVDPAAYLAQLDALGHERSPGRWTQLLADQPFTHVRLRALALFHRSEAFAAAGGTPAAGPLLTDAALDRDTRALLEVR